MQSRDRSHLPGRPAERTDARRGPRRAPVRACDDSPADGTGIVATLLVAVNRERHGGTTGSESWPRPGNSVPRAFGGVYHRD